MTAIHCGRNRLTVVERYDRRRDEKGSVFRVHQEDFCQALGVLPENKYESEGGPSLAILFTDRGPRLAPFYDLICTLAYPDLSGRLAMRIGGENRPAWIRHHHWERFARDVDIKPRLIQKILSETARNILSVANRLALDFEAAYGPSSIVPKILEIITGSTRHIEG